jgi:hypothetical protein
MISTSKCREILKVGTSKISDEDLQKIKEFLYRLARFQKESFEEKKNEDEKRCHLYKGLD